MTAEIAILNRTAVALSADSIVTLVGAQTSKTYDSAEKIFQLSRFQPIGLMIYNNALFMNAPLEVVIRRFREQLTTNQFRELVQVWPTMEAFLIDFKHDDADRLEHFRGMLRAELKQLHNSLITQLLLQIGRPGRRPDLRKWFLTKVAERTKLAVGSPLAKDNPSAEDFMKDVTLDQFADTFSEAIRSITGEWMQSTPVEADDELVRALTEMMFYVVKSDHRSDAYTGFVFAGFGHEELFPTLLSIELDGIYFDQTRTMNRQFIDIDRAGETAAVVPFAQKDMPERFIFGIDRQFEDTLEKTVDAMVSEVVKQAGKTFTKKGAADVKAAAVREYRDGVDRLKKRSEAALKTVVNHMSKKELGELAYSLVELTSRKRRYSTDMETVGGPIDVAILTRNEGFIWVRRKHYFDAQMNPQYTVQQR